MEQLPNDLISFLFTNHLLLIIDKRHFSMLCKPYRILTKGLLCEFEKGFKMNGFVFYEYGCIRSFKDYDCSYIHSITSSLTLNNYKNKDSKLYKEWLEKHIIEKESLEILSCGYFHLLTDKHINENNTALMRGCAAFGNVKLLEKIKHISKFAPNLEDVTTFAALHNQDDVITWAIENKLTMRYNTYLNVVNNKNLPMLQKLYENDMGVMRERNMIDASAIATQMGQIEILKWLHSINFKFEKYHIFSVIMNNHMEILKWLISINCMMSEFTMEYAIQCGNLEIINYLHEIT